jgi:hypothetical protein
MSVPPVVHLPATEGLFQPLRINTSKHRMASSLARGAADCAAELREVEARHRTDMQRISKLHADQTYAVRDVLLQAVQDQDWVPGAKSMKHVGKNLTELMEISRKLSNRSSDAWRTADQERNIGQESQRVAEFAKDLVASYFPVRPSSNSELVSKLQDMATSGQLQKQFHTDNALREYLQQLSGKHFANYDAARHWLDKEATDAKGAPARNPQSRNVYYLQQKAYQLAQITNTKELTESRQKLLREKVKFGITTATAKMKTLMEKQRSAKDALAKKTREQKTLELSIGKDWLGRQARELKPADQARVREGTFMVSVAKRDHDDVGDEIAALTATQAQLDARSARYKKGDFNEEERVPDVKKATR